MILLTIALFLVFSGITASLIYQHLETTKEHVLNSDKITATLLASVLSEHQKALIGVLRSYAARPLFIDAVKQKNVAAARWHLADLKNNHNVDLMFVTDPKGVLWLNHPIFPDALGKDLSHRDWYKGVSAHWKPYVSEVFPLIVADRPLAAAVCVPIFDRQRKVIGILASSERLQYMAGTIELVPFSPYTSVSIVDRVGHILYSNRSPYRGKVIAYPRFPMIVQAGIERRQQFEDSNHEDVGKIYLSIDPVGDSGWTIVIERRQADIYHSEFPRTAEIGVTAFLLFVLFTLSLGYIRRALLLRKTGELLQAEISLRQSDATLRALSLRHEAILAAVPEIIMEVDGNKVYTWANAAGIEFFGEEVIGKDAAFYFEGEQDTYDAVKPLFSGDKDIIYIESRQRRRDGEKRLLAWWCRTLKDKNGQVTGALSSARDITDLKLAEEEIKKLNAELEQRVMDRTAMLENANKELQAFSYSVSHDLRAPLRSIDGFSQALIEEYQEKLDDTGKDYLERIRKATQRMGRLIDDMLKLSLVARHEMQHEPVDLSKTFSEQIEMLRRFEPDRVVNVVVQNDIMVHGDPYLLKIALSNLIDNAWKFTGKTSGARIEFGMFLKDKQRICYIRDNGAGFDMAYVDKLFGAFQRLHKTEEFPGTGIGLATAKRIVSRHGGEIWTEGKVGEGATFFFTCAERRHEQ